jgi:CheY-like chemotaxis protein
MKPVMVIDDNQDILDALEQLLLIEGIETVIARDGVEALRKMDAGKIPSLILLDNAMPLMSGVQFLAVIRQNPKFASIPVYIISASGDFDGSASEIGIRGFIHKPFDSAKVLEIVRRHGEP